ncbi:MAG: LPS export ABC transporter periplasmic protein LptC [bacterium]|nr:LPS export ABC transporter periplasmic protein LptC [bacterium]
MKRLTSVFTVFLVLALIAIASVLFNTEGSDEKPASSPPLTVPGADYSMVLPHFVEMKGNDKVTDVKAESASYFKDDNMADLERPEMVFFGADGKETKIEGRHGIIDTSTNDLLIEGDVVARSPEGHDFKSESLRYVSGPKLVTTDDPISIRGRNFIIRGSGMRLDIENETYYINKDVVAFFNVSGSEVGFD